VTHSVKIDNEPWAGVFTLFSPLVLPPVEATGTIDAVTGTSIIDGDAVFTSALDAEMPHTLTVLDGVNIGLSLQIVTFTQTSLTADRDLGGLELVGAWYEVRATPTPDSLIGRLNWDLFRGTASTADALWIPQENGEYLRVYFASGGIAGTGWRGVGKGVVDMARIPIAPSKGIFFDRRGRTDMTLDFVGQAPSPPRRVALTPGFNPVSRGSIEPLTLQASRLHEAPGLQGGESGPRALIWNPEGRGQYGRYFWSQGGILGQGWRRIGGGAADCGNVALASAFIIELRGGVATQVMIPPLPQ
jgi:hypothetical protein